MAKDKLIYNGINSCKLAHTLFAGSSGCQYGCLGSADCVSVCQFDALKMDAVSGLPKVNIDRCSACGACIEICPRNLFELRPVSDNKMMVYVACMNQDKGGLAKKVCKAACTGCQKCTKIETDDKNVTINNFLSYIDPKFSVENLGSKIVECCPSKVIIGVNLKKSDSDE